MRLVNFAFSVEKNGDMRALPHTAGDVLALLEALGILGRRWKSLLGFLSEDRIEKVDFLCKIYYPVYLIREGKYVIPIDGMDLHRVKLTEFFELRDGYVNHTAKEYDLPLVGNEKLLKWAKVSTEEEIQDGYAIPHTLTGEEAVFIAKEVMRIYLSLKKYLEKLQSEAENAEKKIKEELDRIHEERKKIEEEYGKKIAQKNVQIESLLIDSEHKTIRKIREEFQKQKDSIQNERKNLESLVRNLQTEIKTNDEKMEKLRENIRKIHEEIARLEGKRERLIIYKKKIEEGKEKFDNIKNVIKDIEECERLIDINSKEESETLETVSELEEQKRRISKRIEEIQMTISKLAEEEKLLPSKVDLEIRKAREEFVRKREELIKELNAMRAEHEKVICELRTKENKLKYDLKKFKDHYENLVKPLEEQLGKLNSYMWEDLKLNNDVELLYIPYYLTQKNEKAVLIEPPIVLSGRKKIENLKETGLGLRRELVEAVLGSWEVISVILFEAKEVFDILGPKNRNRIIEGTRILKEIGAINRLQEAILLKGCV